MGLVAELYYLLWWKKRVAFTGSSHSRPLEHFSFLSLCWKRPPSNFHSASSSMELTSNTQGGSQDVEMGIPTTGDKDYNNKGYGEEGIESELMRVHNLSGPPRFLFTIKEENREDLVESEDGRSRKGRSLSDLVFGNGTPFLTPLSSPTVKGLENLDSCYYQGGHGFNPLFDVALSETDINRLRSSPPPKLKFLRDAEDKLVRRLLMEQERSREKGEEKEEREVSSLVKVLPLDSSPVLLEEKSSEK